MSDVDCTYGRVIYTLNFREFLHTMYKYVLNYVLKISVMFAKYFEYYTIILMGGGVFSWTHCTVCFQLYDWLIWHDVILLLSTFDPQQALIYHQLRCHPDIFVDICLSKK